MRPTIYKGIYSFTVQRAEMLNHNLKKEQIKKIDSHVVAVDLFFRFLEEVNSSLLKQLKITC